MITNMCTVLYSVRIKLINFINMNIFYKIHLEILSSHASNSSVSDFMKFLFYILYKSILNGNLIFEKVSKKLLT